jgi:hypothetical protein
MMQPRVAPACHAFLAPADIAEVLHQVLLCESDILSCNYQFRLLSSFLTVPGHCDILT